MRRSVAAFALIRQSTDGRRHWLAQWNRRWQAYNFVGGHKRDPETFRDCVVREIGEELGLRPDVDFMTDPEAIAHYEYSAFSRPSEEETEYIIEVFAAEVAGPEAFEKVTRDPNNRWLSEAEIRAGRCDDGRPVSETMKTILDRLRWPR